MNNKMMQTHPILSLIISCKNPIMRSRIAVGDADRSSEIVQVGSNLELSPPTNVQLENTATAGQKCLMLSWGSCSRGRQLSCLLHCLSRAHIHRCST